MNEALPIAPTGDHRPRVARARRSKMRERLLHAVMICFGNKRLGTLPTVDDIIAQANVVRSTFYRYFDSIEEAAACVAQNLYEEMTQSVNVMVQESSNPLSRVAVAFHLILMRCVADPQWGAFYSQNFRLITDTTARSAVGNYLKQARDQGLIEFRDLNAAVSLLDGALIEGMEQLRSGCDNPRVYVEDITRLCLRGLGVNNEEAKSLVSVNAVFIRATAPDRLKWWRSPW